MKKVLIVDDHPAIRMSVRLLLEHEYYISGEADNGIDAIRLFKSTEPDLIVLDIGIPKLDGFDVIKRMKEYDSTPKIIVLSAQDSSHFMARSLQTGADGFISKMNELTHIKDAVRVCLNGGHYFPSDILAKKKRLFGSDSIHLLDILSDREMSVFMGLCQGKTNKDIANGMLLSEKTVSTYKTRVLEKLHVENIVELIELAKRNEIL
ncbi:response regulator transcription factor [Aeromonas hydrophila]|uniref:response regulator transcription factor n=1 Tax=Aeromonas hydrophila TaxID=644 RepID=UPI00227A0D5B|nr:response regulator transcription factor [Aeromonas hydrophila]WAF90758.1 response regulator transcription factor [Aeromonas hydrophila]WAG03474.1 response regulator transcription factor [Aeromonas hydrophila]